jgi:hypothetical protein
MVSLDAFQEPGLHLTLPFYRHLAPGYTNACILEQFIGVSGDLDLSGYAMGFHAAGHIDRGAPDIVVEFLAADHASDHRAGADADAKGQSTVDTLVLLDVGAHVERQVRHGLGVIHPTVWSTGNDHIVMPMVRIFSRLYFVTSESNRENTSLSRLTISVGESSSERAVKPTMSANRMLTES